MNVGIPFKPWRGCVLLVIHMVSLARRLDHQVLFVSLGNVAAQYALCQG